MKPYQLLPFKIIKTMNILGIFEENVNCSNVVMENLEVCIELEVDILLILSKYITFLL